MTTTAITTLAKHAGFRNREPVPATQFGFEVDPRAAFLARASALDTLYQVGELGLEVAFDRLIDPFLEIVGPKPDLCRHCGDPPWRHSESWCTAVRKADAQRRPDRTKPQRPTPDATIDAIVHSVRTHGIEALKRPDNQERLRRCDARARAEIDKQTSIIIKNKGIS
jgi:hypothetical protein